MLNLAKPSNEMVWNSTQSRNASGMFSVARAILSVLGSIAVTCAALSA